MRLPLVLIVAMLMVPAQAFLAEESKEEPKGPKTEILFSPGGGVRAQLAKRVQQARESIWIATYNIFLPEVTLSLLGAKAKGVQIRILADRMADRQKKSDILLFERNRIPVKRRGGKTRGGIMGESFAIFDGKELAVGTYSWTDKGEKENLGSLVFTEDPKLLRAYRGRFEKLWGEK